MKRFHLSQSVRGALTNWGPVDWVNATEWITRDDGTKFTSGSELKAEFLNLLASGVELIPCDRCDGFDPKNGCPGHEGPSRIATGNAFRDAMQNNREISTNQ